MKRLALIAAVSGSLLLVPTMAWADATDEGPCGNFDFAAAASCKIEVEGGCTANCDAPKVVIACNGKCGATANKTCVDTCGEPCIRDCNPQALDCFKGCHDECDEPAVKLCKEKHPDQDCVKQGKAQCDQHCKNNCKVPDNSCQEHCEKCCTGSCQMQINFDCDFSCMADVQINCQAQCKKPQGGIFCNGNFVNATDIQACIQHLATKLKINVDVSASASGSCSGGNCGGEAEASVGGCASSPSSSNGVTSVLALLGVVTGVSSIRRRKRQQKR